MKPTPLKPPYLADYHIHTLFSDDSDCPMDRMLERAVQLGLDEIAFTEHVDHGVKTDLNCDYPAYFEKLALARKAYADRLIIKSGIEFGVQAGTIPQFQADFDAWPFDFVILSNHQVDNQEFWTYDYQRGKTQDEYQAGYYDAIYDVMGRYKDYSVLGHLDMIKRYDQQGDYPDDKIMDRVDAILKRAIADGKGIEVNTSSFKYKLSDLTPSRRILTRYHELGGTLLTIGSDTHETEHLADHIPEVRAILKDIGFRYFCTFTRMEPEFHPL